MLLCAAIDSFMQNPQRTSLTPCKPPQTGRTGGVSHNGILIFRILIADIISQVGKQKNREENHKKVLTGFNFLWSSSWQ